MKTNSAFLAISHVVLLGALVAVNFGCGKNNVAPDLSSQPVSKQTAPVIVSANKTSFAEVTAQLDPGGNFFLYLGTAQWLEHLSATVQSWRTNLAALPDLSPDNAADLGKAFDLVTALIQDSGVQDVSGLGLSSIELEKGFYHNKMFLHHQPVESPGFLWKLCGNAPHPLTGLDFLPANTALAGFSDCDMSLLWNVTQTEVAKSGFPAAQDFLQQFPAEFAKKTKLNWDVVLHSVGSEIGMAITLNESNTLPIPLPGGAITIPEPGILLVLKVNDETIFNRVDQELKVNPQVISIDQPGLKLRTMPLPIPFIGTLRPSTASSGGYLLISSSDALVNEALAVKNGKTPGLKNTEEFKRLARQVPDQGNQFTFLSERFGRLIYQVQEQTMRHSFDQNGSAMQAKLFQSLFQTQPAFAYSVGANSPQGCLTVGNSSQSFANMALLPAAMVPAILAAVALPNFVKAKTVSQQNTCLNNLRMIDAAKQQWALEKGKLSNATPLPGEIAPYLFQNQLPHCPQGGSYTLGGMNESPKCSIPGHVLP